MAIDPALLNEQQREAPITPGVYLSEARASCVVVRVKDGKVMYLHWTNGTVEAVTTAMYVFARDWPIKLPNYPVRRALLKYRKSNLPVEPVAAAALRAILGAE